MIIHWDPIILVCYILGTVITYTDVIFYCGHMHICVSVCTCMHTCALCGRWDWFSQVWNEIILDIYAKKKALFLVLHTISKKMNSPQNLYIVHTHSSFECEKLQLEGTSRTSFEREENQAFIFEWVNQGHTLISGSHTWLVFTVLRIQPQCPIMIVLPIANIENQSSCWPTQKENSIPWLRNVSEISPLLTTQHSLYL